MPSFTLFQVEIVVLVSKIGLVDNLFSKKYPKKSNDRITKNVSWTSSKAIKNPPNACPRIEAISQVAELMAAAEGKICLGTILAIIDEKVGPEKALIAPVIPMMVNISMAIVQGSVVEFNFFPDNKTKHRIHPI